MSDPEPQRLLEERPLLASEPARARHVSETLKVMAHPVRLSILSILANVPEAHVTGLSGCLEQPAAIISQQLRILRTRGLVDASRHDGYAWYRLTEPDIADLLVVLERPSLGPQG